MYFQWNETNFDDIGPFINQPGPALVNSSGWIQLGSTQFTLQRSWSVVVLDTQLGNHSAIADTHAKLMIYHLKQWIHCLKHCAMMTVLASSPERLPGSLHCILLSLMSYLLVGLVLVDAQRSYLTIVSHISLELGLLTLITYVILRLKKTLVRFYQTLSALVGTNLVMTLISLPVYSIIIGDTVSSEGFTQLEIYLSIALIFWNLAVLSLIFKRAFDIGTVVSAMISFNYFVLYQLLTIWF